MRRALALAVLLALASAAQAQGPGDTVNDGPALGPRLRVFVEAWGALLPWARGEVAWTLSELQEVDPYTLDPIGEPVRAWTQHCPEAACVVPGALPDVGLVITCYPGSLPERMRAVHVLPHWPGKVRVHTLYGQWQGRRARLVILTAGPDPGLAVVYRAVFGLDD